MTIKLDTICIRAAVFLVAIAILIRTARNAFVDSESDEE